MYTPRGAAYPTLSIPSSKPPPLPTIPLNQVTGQRLCCQYTSKENQKVVVNRQTTDRISNLPLNAISPPPRVMFEKGFRLCFAFQAL